MASKNVVPDAWDDEWEKVADVRKVVETFELKADSTALAAG